MDKETEKRIASMEEEIKRLKVSLFDLSMDKKSKEETITRLLIENQKFMQDKLTNVYLRGPGSDKIEKSFYNTIVDNNIDTKGMCIMFVDIDKLKDANDAKGHSFGDKLITSVSNIIKQHVIIDKGDIVCRYGGDEFLVLLNDISHQESIMAAAYMLEDAKKTKIDNTYQVSMSIGFVHASQDELNEISDDYKNDKDYDLGNIIKDYVDRADDGLYQAKRNGRQDFCDNTQQKWLVKRR